MRKRKISVPHATCGQRQVPPSSGIYLAFVQSLIPYRGDLYPQEQEVGLYELLESDSKGPETSLVKTASSNVLSVDAVITNLTNRAPSIEVEFAIDMVEENFR